VLKYWGYKDERHVYFMLAPPWIRFNPAHVYMSCLKTGKNVPEEQINVTD